LSRAIAARRLDLQHQAAYAVPAGGPHRPYSPALTDVALMLLAESFLPEEKVGFNPFQYQIISFLNQEPLRSASTGHGKYGPEFRRLLMHWMDTRDGMYGQQNAMYLAMNLGYGPEVVCTFAVRLLALPTALPYMRAGAACTLARYHGRERVLALTDLFADEDLLLRGGPNNPQPDVQVRDTALAMALVLTDQSVSDYNFDVASTQDGMKYQPTNYRFVERKPRTAEVERSAAFAKWRDWELGLHGALAGPSAAVPFMTRKYPARESGNQVDPAGRPNSGKK
jgi:hypothetical protein